MTAVMLCAAAWMGVLMLVVLWRLWRGPSVADRVVAMDAVNTLVVAAMILCAAIIRQTIFVDVAIVYALLSYVGTLFIARGLKGRG